MVSRKTVQLILISIGIFLILLTYFFYPKVIENKIGKKIIEDDIPQTEYEYETSNTFENVEYNGLYNIDQTFTVNAEKAYVSKENSDDVFMDKMKVILELKDGTVWIITSEKGLYNKATYDCFFEIDVKATDGKTTIFSDNVDLLASKDFASVYNNVYLVNEESNLNADKIDYDFEKKLYKISMFGDKNVEVKLVR